MTMAQMSLNLNLVTELMLHAALEELGFGKDSESNNALCATFAGEVDLAEFAASEGFANFKILEGPASSKSIFSLARKSASMILSCSEMERRLLLVVLSFMARGEVRLDSRLVPAGRFPDSTAMH